jgi:hypothetical protein
MNDTPIIIEKKCSKCGLMVPVDGFEKRRAQCKKCRRAYCIVHLREYYQRKKEKMKTDAAAYRNANKEKIARQKAEYQQKNKEQIAMRKAVYSNANKEKIARQKTEYRQKNAKKVADLQARYRHSNKEKLAAYLQSNKEKIVARRAAYYQANKEKINEKYYTRKKTNPIFNIGCKMRNRVYCAIKSQYTKKAHKTTELLGCDFPTLKRHIEKLFTKGMTWEAVMMGEIHIDHIVPCSKFNLADPAQQKACFHYKNLQPLWAADNLRKSNKILKPTQIVLGI